MRQLLGIVIGIVVAMLVITAVEWLDATLFPEPVINWADPAAIKRMISAIPFAAKALIVIGWGLGAAAGAATAARLARRRWAGWIPVAAVLAGGVYNVVVIDHPWWMDAGAVIAPLIGGWLAIRLAGYDRAGHLG